MFKTDGTVDKIFTGGAGKNGATVAVSEVLTCFKHELHLVHVCPTIPTVTTDYQDQD